MASTNVGSIHYDLDLDTSKFDNAASSLGNTLGSVGKKMIAGFAIVGAAAAAFGAVSVKAFTESEDAIAQTNAVLASTKNVAGITADSITKLATSLQKVTKYSDEDVRSVENLLLTFTAVGKDIFPQATSTVLDMATALGEDTKSASIQLGKALQDPILGITALRKVGVNFNDAQKDVIQKLVDTGKTAEAQKLILKELQTEFGGSAEAAGKTFAGSLARLKNSFNDIQESIGQVIVRGLTPFVAKIAEFLSKIDWEKEIKTAVGHLNGFWYALSGEGVTSGGTYGKIEEVLVVIRDIGINTFNTLKTALDFLMPSLIALWNAFEINLLPTLKRLWEQVIVPLAPVIGVILVGALWLAINALRIMTDVISFVINIFIDLFTFITVTLPNGITTAL
jgi:hypothetical protein